MIYVLDTTVVSALMRGDANVLSRLAQVARADVLIPQPVIAEIAYGIQRLPKSKRRKKLEERFELIRDELVTMVWSDEVSRVFGVIKATLERRGQRIEDFDAAVASHALATASVLVTANVKHMVRIAGLEVEDWSRG